MEFQYRPGYKFVISHEIHASELTGKGEALVHLYFKVVSNIVKSILLFVTFYLFKVISVTI